MTLSKQYGVFIVRVWREPTETEEGPWRASVLNTVTKERTYFTSSEELVAFLNPLELDDEEFVNFR